MNNKTENTEEFELDDDLRDRFKQLKLTCEKGSDNLLHRLASQYGYVDLGYVLTHETEGKCLLVKMPKSSQALNDGIYGLKSIQAEDDPNIYSAALLVIRPNTISHGKLITRLTDSLVRSFDQLPAKDTSILTIYDWTEIFSLVTEKTVVMPLAASLFPGHDAKDRLKRERFITTYMSRFLSNVALLNAGVPGLDEEAVNSEPIWFKNQIDSVTEGKTDDKVAEENRVMSNDLAEYLKHYRQAEKKQAEKKQTEQTEANDQSDTVGQQGKN